MKITGDQMLVKNKQVDRTGYHSSSRSPFPGEIVRSDRTK